MIHFSYPLSKFYSIWPIALHTKCILNPYCSLFLPPESGYHYFFHRRLIKQHSNQSPDKSTSLCSLDMVCLYLKVVVILIRMKYPRDLWNLQVSNLPNYPTSIPSLHPYMFLSPCQLSWIARACQISTPWGPLIPCLLFVISIKDHNKASPFTLSSPAVNRIAPSLSVLSLALTSI